MGSTIILNFFILFFTSAVLPEAQAADNIISEKDFVQIINTLEVSYTDIVKINYQATLVFEKNWVNETVNATAYRDQLDPKIWRIQVPGGMARANGMTKDAFALVLCHELGHHLGGAPHSFLYGGWPSAEGQADYWATSKCLKKYFYEVGSEPFHFNNSVPPKVLADCSSVYHQELEQNICVRSMMASIEFGQFLNALAIPKTVVHFDASDTRVVKGTNTNDYPRAQCRFDTLYQGALCPISFTQMTSDLDTNIASCTSYETFGARPLCWFSPE
jgi:hypothetical protein